MDSLSGGPHEAAYIGDLAGFLSEHQRREPSLRLLRLALRWDPSNPKLWNNLGSTLLMMGEPGQAAEALTEGLKHKPDALELRYNLGKAYLDGGIYGRAITELRRAVAMRPSFAPAHYDLARAAMQDGDWPVAAEALRAYLRLAPDAPNRVQVEAALREAERQMSGGGPQR
jgi:tetratricopeptide (TPR) repeat protein